jgi:hypothetical protein
MLSPSSSEEKVACEKSISFSRALCLLEYVNGVFSGEQQAFRFMYRDEDEIHVTGWMRTKAMHWLIRVGLCDERVQKPC